ncbi:MAG: Gfo/Idh/MocA family oxidoreductase [Armatimonadetes bacterium]|nr:Gfo/Idh/MocA family oxidoreductase [Armatimonadota bacterium]
MGQREIGVGIIGCGLMGKELASASARWIHLNDLPFRPRIVAACDTNPKALEWFDGAHRSNKSYKSFRTYSDLLESTEVDAVYCAVPHNLHAQIYTDILKADKHLFAEKPFGIDLAACENILSEAAKHPELLVRVSSEFPFYPGVQRILKLIEKDAFGQIIEVHAGFCHSSDLDPTKPINWKRRIETNGEYGVMGDLGMHVVHVPFRAGWFPTNVRALLANIVAERPGPDGKLEPCETWDNATLACETQQGFPMLLETKRIAPGEMNTWFLKVYGTKLSVEYSTKRPKTLRLLPYEPGFAQAWREEDLGYASAYPAITGGIFEFGFPDAIQQMFAAFLDELVHGPKMIGPTRCATPEEALRSHELFTAALESQKRCSVVKL